jgi:hypothetical protein
MCVSTHLSILMAEKQHHTEQKASSSSFTVGPVSTPTVGTAAYRLIVPPCFRVSLAPPGALRAQMSRQTSGRERDNYGRKMAD